MKLARERGADLVAAFIHWGWEFEMYPHKNVMEAARKVMDMGVDVIVGTVHNIFRQPEGLREACLRFEREFG